VNPIFRFCEKFSIFTLNAKCRFTALAGLFLAIVIAESCVALPLDQTCASSALQFIRALCTLSTAGTVLLMCRQLSFSIRIEASKAALASRQPGKPGSAAGPSAAPTPAGRTFALRLLRPGNLAAALFIALNCVHIFPGTPASIVSFPQLGRDARYRPESLITVRAPAHSHAP
jgi:hypothetical protein